MKLSSAKKISQKPAWVIGPVIFICLAAAGLFAAPQTATKKAPAVATAQGATRFDSPQQAVDALLAAAQQFDVVALEQIFGPDGQDIVFSGEVVRDRTRATEFAGKASEKKGVSVDPKNANRAYLVVGNEDWPFPVPIVKVGEKWAFDAAAGRQEILYRRIGANELDAIQICHTYVNAQHEYALLKRDGYFVNQYAQRIISTPGKQDGLAWQNADGSWGGPLGEEIAHVIGMGYSVKSEPYHGYFFKVLKGQGPSAPLGEMDFVVKDVMIGGFALVAAPAEYGVTGLKTFIVSHDGVVFENMVRYDPDKTWTPVSE
jgi:hypothetical protein